MIATVCVMLEVTPRSMILYKSVQQETILQVIERKGVQRSSYNTAFGVLHLQDESNKFPSLPTEGVGMSQSSLKPPELVY